MYVCYYRALPKYLVLCFSFLRFSNFDFLNRVALFNCLVLFSVFATQVVWAKHGLRPQPPFPALVWDPRFLDKSDVSHSLAEVAHSTLGRCHLVRLYNAGQEFRAMKYE